ncbi:hypothetical protein [Priestia megaterium]|nr:hypothetical protein [Priestia megaterium]
MEVKSFVEIFNDIESYREWLFRQDVKVVSVIVFEGKLVVTFTLW